MTDSLETDQLARLIEVRHALLSQLWRLAGHQSELVEHDDMQRMISLLAVKQRVLNQLQQVERQLDPFRGQDPDRRIWRSAQDRHRCREVAEACDQLLRQIMDAERESERELIQRRDQTAAVLQGVHNSASASQAYVSSLELRGSHFDASCDT